jgi:2-phospho-L-lactate guanylyltransferase
MWAVVPLKSPGEAKSRLAAVLSAAQRVHLFFALAERAILALQATPGVQVVAVATASAEVAAFARSLDAEVVRLAADLGTASAFVSAIIQLRPLRLERVLMVAGDLPLVSAAALERVVALADSQPGIVVVPDRHRVGTNALLCSPPEVVTLCFGGDSFRLHLQAARTAGVPARVLELDALALDLDVAADLDYLGAAAGAPAAELFHALRYVDVARMPSHCAAGATR